MSLTLLIWLGLFAGLAVLALFRPAWGVAAYMLTVFLCPPFWWWGNDGALATFRWNFYGGCILLAAVLISRSAGSRMPESGDRPESRRLRWLALGIFINASLVHWGLAESWAISAKEYEYLTKFVLLFFLIQASVRSSLDFRIILLAVVLGAAYVGYEVTVNDRGTLSGNRLEGVGVPNAAGANSLASLMVTMLPIAGTLFLVGRRWERLLAMAVTPMIANVLLLCNSRGAFLAAFASAGAFLVGAPRRVRIKAIKLLALGGIAVWLLLGDPRIVERFATTFADPSERDHAAAERLDYWKAGFRMIADYPLGGGGDGFHSAHGTSYLLEMGLHFEARSVHNGYINEACDWGIQGFLLKMAFQGMSVLLLWRTIRAAARRGDDTNALLGCGILAGSCAFLMTAPFGDYMDNEWGYWLPALAIGYARVGAWVPSVRRGAAESLSEHRWSHRDYSGTVGPKAALHGSKRSRPANASERGYTPC